MHFDYDPVNPTNGILYYLFHYHNKYYKNYVQVAATSWNSNNPPYNAIDFNDNLYWISKESDIEAYLTISFPVHKVILNGYLLKSSNWSSDEGYFAKKWSFAYSKDNVNFLNKTYENSNEELKGSLKTKFIEYKTEEANYFRIYPIENTNNELYKGFDLNQIEFFGDLFFLDLLRTCRHSFLQIPIINILIFIIY